MTPTVALEFCTISPIPGKSAPGEIRVHARFLEMPVRAESETIELVIRLPGGDRGLAALQGELFDRAIALLQETRRQYRISTVSP